MIGKTQLLNAGERDVRSQVLEALHRFGIKQVEVARKTGINNSSLSLWLQGKIKGHQVRIESTLDEWLKSLYSSKPQFNSKVQPSFFTNKDQFTMNHLNFDKQKLDGCSGCGVGMDIEGSTTTESATLARQEYLVPVQIDLEYDNIRVHEFFCWNVYEPYMTPESFSHLVSEENNFPPMVENEIAQQIKRAVQNHKPYEPKGEQMLKVIELNIRIDNIYLKDKFEWDINNQSNSPEEFAHNLATELGLNGEFQTRIAHSIRQQISYYQKQQMDKRYYKITDFQSLKKSTRSLLESSNGYTDINYKIQFENHSINEHNYMRPLLTQDNADNLSQWQPYIEILDDDDIKKYMKLEERKHRYVRRVKV